MPQQKRPRLKSGKKAFVIGRAGFAKISAVEGIRLTPEMNERAAKASREGLSADAHRREIIRAHRKS